MLSLTPEQLMLAALVIPYIAAVLIPLCWRVPNIREGVTLVAAVALATVVWNLYPHVIDGARPEIVGFSVAPGLDFAFKVEPLGLLFGLVASTLWVVNSVYSIGYMRGNNEPRQTQFYVCFAVALGATIALAFSKNLFTLFIFYELLTLSTYPLVTHKATPDAFKAGRVYLFMLVGTSMVLLLPAIIATWVFAGTLDFTPGGIFADKVSPVLMGGLLVLFIFGIGKAALMPGHFWLPAAMVAPTPVSALLHAVAVVKAGVFTVLKVIVFIFGIETLAEAGTGAWLLWAASFTVLTASIIALRQDNLKKRLAYSTVSQLSYIVLAAAILTPISVIGAAMHIAGHAVAKITLFFAAGSIYTAAHKTEISELNGIGWKMPWTMTAFAVGSLAMIGLPPTAGFFGKWFMLSAASTTQDWLVIAVIVLSTVLNACYFLPIIIRAFFREPEKVVAGHAVGAQYAGHNDDHGEAPWPIVVALTVTASMTVLLFFFPSVPFNLAQLMVAG
ncbi:NADH-ubiquinone oxidoreductase chain L [Candidatus Filomicrobium marinum]|uniref:NADH-ubiquinone oxidoreductase chain L n=1 Tax=Candidatus Filomicrobium marinum TaxID=1608628 RepID=A0A0D6JKG2_9HYPH|nr:proton-conducting transporter membrane subunit [Candidatus Filomicrobium marinum]CFX61214.1 NADH-ubiquinone oxidoreductase chain L [Candidatus Filomicrobium marinum]CPR22453.1 NADH-ubiquinone oxidoreductase chain L [Candidatus Filomicrobium marinum]